MQEWVLLSTVAIVLRLTDKVSHSNFSVSSECRRRPHPVFLDEFQISSHIRSRPFNLAPRIKKFHRKNLIQPVEPQSQFFFYLLLGTDLGNLFDLSESESSRIARLAGGKQDCSVFLALLSTFVSQLVSSSESKRSSSSGASDELPCIYVLSRCASGACG